VKAAYLTWNARTTVFLFCKYIQLYLQEKYADHKKTNKKGLWTMQKSLQTKCLLNSQRCIQSDTLRDQTITSRRVSGTSSAWSWTSESGGAWILAVDEFSCHEAGELVVANRHGRWIRNFSKVTSQLSAFTCGRRGNQYVVSLSSPRCHVHHVYRVYSSFITYQW